MSDIKHEFSGKYDEFYFETALLLIKNHNANLKKRILEIIRNYLILSGVFITIIIYFSALFSFQNMKLFLVIFILALPLFWVLMKSMNPEKTEEDKFKYKFMDKFLGVFGSFEWKSSTSVVKRLQDIRKCLIFPKYFTLTFDDYFYGWYKDEVEITINECATEKNSFFTILPAIIPTLGCLAIIGIVLFFIILSIFFAVLRTNTITGTPSNILSGIGIFLIVVVPFITTLKLAWSSINRGKFQGLVIECNMPKKFKGETCIYEKNLFSNNTINFKSLKALSSVTLEDINIEKEFYILSTDQIEARYIFTTSFIERFRRIKNIYNAKYIRAYFKDNKMTMMINTGKDLFYFSQLKKLSKKDFDKIYCELCTLFSLIEDLKLNQNIGL